MSEKEQLEFLLKIGYGMKDAIEIIKKMSETAENTSNLNENKKPELEHTENENASKSSSEMSENDLKKMLESMQTELREMRESIHAQNRKNAVIETANTQPKTVDENVEELLKSMEVS